MFKGKAAKPQSQKRKHESQHMITHPKKARLVDDEEASNSPNTSQTDDKVANMVYQRKQNLHFTMPVIKKTIDKKPKLHANNKNSSDTKKQIKNPKAEDCFFQTKKDARQSKQKL